MSTEMQASQRAAHWEFGLAVHGIRLLSNTCVLHVNSGSVLSEVGRGSWIVDRGPWAVAAVSWCSSRLQIRDIPVDGEEDGWSKT